MRIDMWMQFGSEDTDIPLRNEIYSSSNYVNDKGEHPTICSFIDPKTVITDDSELKDGQ